MLRTPIRRRGAAALEAAIILPLTFLLLLGLIVGGMGVFRYQEVAFLAREGARYASVRGGMYEREVKLPAASAEEVYQNAILPRVVSLDTSLLNSSVSWTGSNEPYSVEDNYEAARTNMVSVTVSYQWFPELYIVGPITLTSTSTVPMHY